MNAKSFPVSIGDVLKSQIIESSVRNLWHYRCLVFQATRGMHGSAHKNLFLARSVIHMFHNLRIDSAVISGRYFDRNINTLP